MPIKLLRVKFYTDYYVYTSLPYLSVDNIPTTAACINDPTVFRHLCWSLPSYFLGAVIAPHFRKLLSWLKQKNEVTTVINPTVVNIVVILVWNRMVYCSRSARLWARLPDYRQLLCMCIDHVFSLSGWCTIF